MQVIITQIAYREFTHIANAKRGMENAWEPTKKRNSCVTLERLLNESGTVDHMVLDEWKGPQP